MKNAMISALKISGEVLLSHFNTAMEIKIKETQSNIVTEADIKSDEAIISVIKKQFPAHNILSEESGLKDNGSKYTWVIDPLDGTSNFAAGIPWFGVLIALFKDNTPIMGGAYLPVQEMMYVAEKGKGAFKNGKPLVMATDNKLVNSLCAFSMDYSEDEVFINLGIEMYRFIIKGSRNIRSTNSLMDFLFVAEGKFGLCVNLFTKVWDISALGLIIEEAGGVMKDLKGMDIHFTMREEIIDRNFPVIAGSTNILDSMKEVFSY